MIRIILLFTVFVFLAGVTVASPRTAAISRTPSAPTTTSPKKALYPHIPFLPIPRNLPNYVPKVVPPIPPLLPSLTIAVSPGAAPAPEATAPFKTTSFPKTATSLKTTLSFRTVTLSTTSPPRTVTLSTTSSSSTTTSPLTKVTIKAVFWISRRLQTFVERVKKRCDFTGLDDVNTELQYLWEKVMNEGSEPTSKVMQDARKILKKLLKYYNECGRKNDHQNFEVEWERYTKIFGKKYTAGEKAMRKEIFRKNKEDVEKHNELYRNGRATYNASLNHFSDWTEKELERANGFRPPNATRQADSNRMVRFVEGQTWRYYYYNSRDRVPASIDWRTRGYVTPVEDQGTCGSCYAIAGNGALEAYHRRQTGDLVVLSTQNILDCTWHLGNSGCTAGYHVKVFNYAETFGVVRNSWYPYTMNASHNCLWSHEQVVATARGYYIVEEGSELALRNAVADLGPVAVGISSKNLRKYDSGIFHIDHSWRASHSVLVVGYGTDPKDGDYWIIRNSWGVWWGEDGYFRLVRNRNNMCEIATYAYLPL